MRKAKLLSIFFLIGLMFVPSSCSKNNDREEVKKQQGQTIIETGQISAINSQAFLLARYGRYWWEMKVIGILEHGAIVNAGDSIIQLDPTDVNKRIIDWEIDLEQQNANMETLIVNQENARNTLESSLKNEQASFNLKRVELEATRFEAARIQKIKSLEFKQAEIRLAKEKRKIELNKIIQKSDYLIQSIKVKQVETRIKNAYDILPQLTIRTPIPGVFQIAVNRRTNTLVKVGDDLYPGAAMASVPELTWMRIDTHVNETDFLKIRVGQKVSVRLDAMPDVVFDGEISYIGKLCKKKDPKSRQKVFDVEVKMLQSDERLKPGMTVSCEYL